MIYARIVVKWTGRPHDTYIYNNITETDVSFYDDYFWSRPGYADFTIKFAFNPLAGANTNNTDEVNRFSAWWNNLNKNSVPRMTIELFDGNSPEPLANGYLYEWEENREDFEVVFTCIDEMSEVLDEQVSRSVFAGSSITGYQYYPIAYLKISENIVVQTQPTGPGNPPGDDELPPIFPPGMPTISYTSTLNEFFWTAINEWWNLIRGNAPVLVRPQGMPPFYSALSILGGFSNPINAKLQTYNNGTFRVYIMFKRLTNLERKEILSDLSKFVQSKLVCKNGIHFIVGINPVSIEGYIQSVNPNTETVDIEPDRILDRVVLQRRNYNGSWTDIASYQQVIISARNNWLREQLLPRTEYNIWGYASVNTPILQAGYRIKLDNVTYKIKEISYESETMHTIKSFEAVCVK